MCSSMHWPCSIKPNFQWSTKPPTTSAFCLQCKMDSSALKHLQVDMVFWWTPWFGKIARWESACTCAPHFMTLSFTPGEDREALSCPSPPLLNTSQGALRRYTQATEPTEGCTSRRPPHSLTGPSCSLCLNEHETIRQLQEQVEGLHLTEWMALTHWSSAIRQDQVSICHMPD